MKKFYASLREHVKNIIDFEKNNDTVNKRRIKITSRCKSMLYLWKKNTKKVRYHCHYTGKYSGPANSIYNLRFNVPNEIPVVFQNDSNYDYNFIIK